MRFLIRLKSKDNKKIPLNYQHALSSLIYRFMEEANEELSSRIHQSKGFKYFNFSLLNSEDRIIDGDEILFPKDSFVVFNLSSPDSELLRSAVEGMFKTEEINLLEKKFDIEPPRYISPPDFASYVKFKSLSPIYIDSTRNEKRWDLLPTDPEWRQRIEENSRKKYYHYFGKEYAGPFEIPEITRMRSKRINVGGQWWRAANAEFTLKASSDMLKFLWDTGIGSRNSQGFGCLEYRRPIK